MVCKDPKTEKSKRTILIPHVLTDQLCEYKEWYDREKEKWGDAWQGEDWVFVNKTTAKRISTESISQWVNKVLTFCGTKHHTVHSLRHTNITMKLLNNIPVLEISAEAGHSRVSTTTDIYGHFMKTHRSQSAELFDTKFAQGNIITIPRQ